MTIEKAKEVLGKTGQKMTDSEIEKLVGSFQYLIDFFMEKQEIKIFGSPLRKLLEK